MKKKLKNFNWAKILTIFVLVTLILSIGYSIVMIVISDPGAVQEDAADRNKSNYVLMLLQCILGVICIFLPSLIEHKLKIEIPNGMYLLFIVFLYCAIYLGEVRSFYYLISYWDVILHTFSGAMLGALGFSVVRLLNENPKATVNMSPLFVAFFALTFAVFMGVVWEIYEYVFDGILKINMQKFASDSGTPLVGRDALEDTMVDLIVDMLGALAVSILGYISLKHKKEWLKGIEVRKKKED